MFAIQNETYLSTCASPLAYFQAFKLIKGIASIDRVTDVIQWVESIKAAPSRRQGGAVQPRGRALVEAANKE